MHGKTGVPNLTDAQIEHCLELVREGQRIPTIAKFFGVTRQALYARKYRNEDFARALEAARAEYEFDLIRELKSIGMSAGPEKRQWLPLAWLLERTCGVLSAVDAAKVRALDRGSDESLLRQRRLRDFIAAAQTATDGDPNADLSAPSDDDASVVPPASDVDAVDDVAGESEPGAAGAGVEDDAS